MGGSKLDSYVEKNLKPVVDSNDGKKKKCKRVRRPKPTVLNDGIDDQIEATKKRLNPELYTTVSTTTAEEILKKANYNMVMDLDEEIIVADSVSEEMDLDQINIDELEKNYLENDDELVYEVYENDEDISVYDGEILDESNDLFVASEENVEGVDESENVNIVEDLDSGDVGFELTGKKVIIETTTVEV